MITNTSRYEFKPIREITFVSLRETRRQAVNSGLAVQLVQLNANLNKKFDFSFSGLKTAVSRYLEKSADYKKADVAASFQEAVVDVLITKSLSACKESGIDCLVIAGGVAANSRLRQLAADRCKAAGIKLSIPPIQLCTDNGAMVAALGRPKRRNSTYESTCI